VVTRLALTLISGIILVVASWATTVNNAVVHASGAVERRAYHEAERALLDTLPQEPAANRFTAIGSVTCRACHRAIFAAWVLSPHASADTALSEEQSLEAGCQRCHSPLFDLDHPVMSAEVAVSCEVCHGPGSAYSSLSVMIDPLKRAAAGLQNGRQACRGCHNPGHAHHVERDLVIEGDRVHPAPSIRTHPY
jgi:hypothetical protein